VNRKTVLLEWSKKILQDKDCSITSASSDASFRSYWRIFSNAKTYIVMDAPPEHENCLPFIDLSEKLIECKVNVPRVLEKDLTLGFLLLTDLGSIQYLDKLNNINFKTLYQDALNALHTIQQDASVEDLKFYDKTLLKQEMKLFDTWFIEKHLGIETSEVQKKIISNIQELLINNALEQPQTFVHRDYHSRNLMITKDNNPGILDFQDAVVGPVTYDLVSLLRDCYISWEESDVNELSDKFRIEFNRLNKREIKNPQWQKWFDLMGMQRHLKAVGIFCRLNYRDNKPNYLKDINLTFNYIKSVCLKYPEFKDFSLFLQSITPTFKKL
jgi:aminoglycoside/choline kinase family phosphotransferase